jgi:3'(2'),5'-bisphosphate nucleotidase
MSATCDAPFSGAHCLGMARSATPPPALTDLATLARAAGRRVRSLYLNGCARSRKADGSPVTVADREAETIIVAGLADLWPGVPIVAEEAVSEGARAQFGERFFLVDPLDGTRDFVEGGNGEFTVNIALVEAGAPTLGVVYVPMDGRLYAGDATGAWRADCLPDRDDAAAFFPIGVRAGVAAPRARVVASRRSLGLDRFLDRLGAGEPTRISSSVKFCLIAEGAADLYPRLSPVSEWDSAAGEAVLRAAGGGVIDLKGGRLRYGNSAGGFAVPGFIAYGAPQLETAAREALLAA